MKVNKNLLNNSKFDHEFWDILENNLCDSEGFNEALQELIEKYKKGGE